LRRKPTDAEQSLWHFLRRGHLGFRFRRQFSIPPYFVDFACIEARLVIEADGGQHAAPAEHDRRDTHLTSRGWTVLRFWNNDILQNQDGAFRVIIDALAQTPAPGRPLPRPSPVATGEGEPRSGWEGAGTTASIVALKGMQGAFP